MENSADTTVEVSWQGVGYERFDSFVRFLIDKGFSVKADYAALKANISAIVPAVEVIIDPKEK